ncbi:MAG TPA: 4-hydroxy-3-methylbut-2-enyl diphosphate reductase [Sumerlaeia bacterium]|nr:4-hydroxy-3-methylbut-2-enyl diphosphate reductase [Sumerlaeia bacterium]
MKIIQAKAAGFCMGVRRAMDTVLEEARRRRKPVMTYGPLIHNPQVIEVLDGKGIRVLGRGRSREPEGTVVIRAHGATPAEKEELIRCGYEVVDATCPHVIHIQRLLTRHVEQGDSVLIIGDPGHAEVEGLLGFARGRGFAVNTEAEVAALPELERVCVVSQTTQSQERFDRLLGLIQKRWPECVVYRTICDSTNRRQEETVEIARAVDAMIVVGGKNSANTVRLAQLAAETGTLTFHVENSSQLDFPRLRGVKTIGLTAGASTPNWMIVDLAERLEEFSRRESSAPKWVLFDLVEFFLNSHLYIAFGVVCAVYGCSSLLGLPFRPLAAAVAALYVFGLSSLDVRPDGEYRTGAKGYFIDPPRWRFYQQWGPALTLLGGTSLIAALILSAFISLPALCLTFLVESLAALLRLSPAPGRFIPYVRHRRLIDLPGGKDVFTGTAWAVLLTLLPSVAAASPFGPFSPPVWTGLSIQRFVAYAVTFLFVFSLVFIRSVVTDFRDIQGDQIIGRETIPVVLGKDYTKTLLAVLTGVLLLAMIIVTAGDALTPLGYFMIFPLLYTWGYLYIYHRRLMKPGMAFEALIGGKFILIGILALLQRACA